MRRLALLILASAACSSQASPNPTRSLDNPIDMTFACLGVQDVDGVPTTVVLPPRACSGEAPALPDGGVPAGEPDAAAPFTVATSYAFILEGARGDVMAAQITAQTPFLRDADPLAPGLNGLRVGDSPVGIATTPDGCFSVVANRGSCDVTAIDVLAALQNDGQSIYRLRPTTGTGVLASRPGGIATLPSLPPPIGPTTCADAPAGYTYVAYPSCHLVARIDLASGAMVDGVQLTPGQPPQLVGADVVCPAECEGELPPPLVDAGPQPDGAPATPDAATGTPDGSPGLADAGVPPPPPEDAAGEPAALLMDPDGTRLYVAAWNASQIAIVSLSADGGPTGVEIIPLENAIGVLRLAVTPDLPMGNTGDGGTFRFLYAVARDRTVHVVDVTPGRAARECDTQVDPRFARDILDPQRMSCFPVGDPATPARRPLARGPGIHFPDQAIPLDVAFTGFNQELGDNEPPQPFLLNGVFAFVTALGPSSTAPRGLGFYVNVNDQNYPDIEDIEDPRVVETAISMPHTLRDQGADRHIFPQSCSAGTTPPELHPPRLGDIEAPNIPGFGYNFRDQIAEVERDGGVDEVVPRFLPSLHMFLCSPTQAAMEHTTARPQMIGDGPDEDELEDDLLPDPERDAIIAAQREQLFPDLAAVRDEVWSIRWEGPLTLIASQSRRTGARVTVSGDGMTVDEPSALLCDLGAQPMDIVTLLGCDTDADCGPGEICAIHPEAPSGLDGMCVPPGAEQTLLAQCADLFTTVRRYTAVEVFANKLELRPRHMILTETPVGGCDDTMQCQALANAVADEATSTTGTLVEPGSFVCEVDESRGGPPRCVMTCDAGCGVGSVCDEATNRCILGPIPDQACLEPLQRYEVSAGDAFVVIGGVTGYLHPVVVDPLTQACVIDPDKHALQVGRFHQEEPPCGELATGVTTPNPCRLEGLEEPVGRENVDELSLRETWAIRLRNPALSMDIVDVAIPIPYEAGAGRWYSPVATSVALQTYELRFEITGGFVPVAPNLSAQLPVRVVRSPAGFLWVVDSGEGTSSAASIFPIKGQVIGIDVLPQGGDARLF